MLTHSIFVQASTAIRNTVSSTKYEKKRKENIIDSKRWRKKN